MTLDAVKKALKSKERIKERQVVCQSDLVLWLVLIMPARRGPDLGTVTPAPDAVINNDDDDDLHNTFKNMKTPKTQYQNSNTKTLLRSQK